MSKKPKIGITMGDPNGIGPEVVVKALCCAEIQELCEPVVFGSAEILEEAQKLFGLRADCELIEAGDFGKDSLMPGTADEAAGRASLSYIEKAVDAALKKEIDALVTAPICKESIHMAGSKHPGHTEMLGELTGTGDAIMMFEGSRFRVVLVTIHTALSNVHGLITKEKVFNTIRAANDSLINLFKIAEPKIAVCGLNPHAGESGAFGDEEIVSIAPAVLEAREIGIDVTGPMPADTLFYYANQGTWDAVVAMYHDQGLVPFKMVSFEDGVNLTIGLPIIRTSPDHGTAFDIAWDGTADPSSMVSAIKLALRLAGNKSTDFN
jgi:4-hydroxythreonine-4-phosphate dehydrogenase